MLTVAAFSVAIIIVHSNPDSGPLTIETVCDSVRHAAYLGGYCAKKLALGMEPLHTTTGSQGPPTWGNLWVYF